MLNIKRRMRWLDSMANAILKWQQLFYRLHIYCLHVHTHTRTSECLCHPFFKVDIHNNEFPACRILNPQQQCDCIVVAIVEHQEAIALMLPPLLVITPFYYFCFETHSTEYETQTTSSTFASVLPPLNLVRNIVPCVKI